jgi:hypothetical protein
VVINTGVDSVASRVPRAISMSAIWELPIGWFQPTVGVTILGVVVGIYGFTIFSVSFRCLCACTFFLFHLLSSIYEDLYIIALYRFGGVKRE